MSDVEHTPSVPTKQCSKCEESFPATTEFFYHHPNTKDKWQNKCKACAKNASTTRRKLKRVLPTRLSCLECQTEYPATMEYFPFLLRQRRYRLSYLCLACATIAEQQRLAKRKTNKQKGDHAYYTTHIAHIKQRSKTYYETYKEKAYQQSRQRRTQNPVTWARYQKNYRTKHAEAIHQKDVRWKKANPHKTKQYLKNWKAKNPGKVRAKDARYRAGKHRAPINDFTAAQWEAMQVAYGHCCVYCDKRCKGNLTRDHITPLSKGGNHTASNIVPACRSCNSKKRDKAVLNPVQPMLLL